ncbi:MAG: adenylate/guanylate cyclase domain-containing protein [Myxococcota bacterium]
MKTLMWTDTLEWPLPLQAAWDVVADSDRGNQATGVGVPDITPHAQGAARFVFKRSAGPATLEYEEHPLEWQVGRFLHGKRVFLSGPLAWAVMSWELTPVTSERTQVRLRLRAVPRSPLVSPLASLVGRMVFRDVFSSLQRCGDNIRRNKPAYGVPPPRLKQDAFQRAADATVKSVTEAQRAIARRLVEHVATADDHDVRHLRPFALADAWRLPRRDTLITFLHAVNAGLLELTWELVCPSCLTGTETAPTLSAIAEHGRCQFCDISFGLEFDRSVEATFRPSSTVREWEVRPFCISGPFLFPHVEAQAILPPRGTVEVTAPGAAGRCRIFVRGGLTVAVDVVADGPAQVRTRVGETAEPAALTVAPGGTITVEHALDVERHLRLERLGWANTAATAMHLSLLPEFRRMFSAEVLRTNLSLTVQRVGLLFTDLTASTSLYTRAGDAVAFRLVQEHFELLGAVIARHQGTLVKTIGDAVMAAFPDEESLVRAAVDMQRAFPAFRAERRYAPDVFLRVGVHIGPVYAATANKLIDYFGQTVNIAARLQGTAQGGEVVMTAELAERAQAQGWLWSIRQLERFDANVKGLDAPIRAARAVVTTE